MPPGGLLKLTRDYGAEVAVEKILHKVSEKRH